LLLSSGCWKLGYLVEQGAGQLALLHQRRRITEVLGRPDLPEETRAGLTLAVEARRFGVEVLGLRGGDNFTRFVDTHGRPVAWNLSAAPKDSLRPLSWSFPITGRVPYLGYFKPASVRRQALALKRAGYDVYVRPVAAYSTLGKLSDPIYSTMLDSPPSRLVEVVLHEMTHGTVWIPGRVSFNESLASFVGLQGAALFFGARGGSEAGRAIFAEAESVRRREREFTAFLRPHLEALRALYASPISREAKLAERQALFDRARADYLARFPVPPGRRAVFLNEDQGGLNNAVFAGFAVYHEESDLHERTFARVGRDLRRFLALYQWAATEDDPQRWLEEVAAGRRPVPSGI
jgi:predicted aminopeptidase